MIREAFEFLVGLGRDSMLPNVAEVDGIPGRALLTYRGEKEWITFPAPLRTPVLVGLSDLELLLGDEEIAPLPEVYVSGDAVVAFLDRRDRRSRARLPLCRSETFINVLTALHGGTTLEPHEAVRFLRLSLATDSAVPDVVDALSRIDFTRKSSGKTDVAHGREALGRDVEAQVQQADRVPKTFPIELSVFSNPGMMPLRARVICAVQLEPQRERITLKLLPDELDRAVTETVTRLAALLRREMPTVPVFLGNPGAEE